MARLGGKEVSESIVSGLKPVIEELAGKGVIPTLGVLRVGERGDDLAYERGLLKKFESCDCKVDVTVLDAECTQEELDSAFDKMNEDSNIHGILVFRPLPKHLSDSHIIETIDPGKDVDFMNSRNLAGVIEGRKDAAAPCTAEAVISMIRHYGIETRGKKAVVAVVEHYIADPSEDVRLADCQVREVFVGGEFVWRATRRQMTAWELADAYTRYAGRRCA